MTEIKEVIPDLYRMQDDVNPLFPPDWGVFSFFLSQYHFHITSVIVPLASTNHASLKNLVDILNFLPWYEEQLVIMMIYNDNNNDVRSCSELFGAAVTCSELF